ncbi:hypothetical protein JS562_36670, partial [Agrobacterium sp. S2]|nr:hypothetical protein [Agrobacterium sp. S2]
ETARLVQELQYLHADQRCGRFQHIEFFFSINEKENWGAIILIFRFIDPDQNFWLKCHALVQCCLPCRRFQKAESGEFTALAS